MSFVGEEIFLPCRELRVRARFSERKGLTPLERLFLRAVNAGVEDFLQLIELFGLGSRPTLDLAFDLWQQGHVRIDLAQGRLSLSPELRRQLAEGDPVVVFDQRRGGQYLVREVPVLVDYLTGMVLPREGARSRPGANSRIVPSTRDLRLEGLSLDEIHQVVERDRQFRVRKGLEQADLGTAHFDATDLELTSKVLWLRVVVDASLDPETARLHFRVATGRALDARARREVERRLTALSEEVPPNHTFFKQIREHVEKHDEPDDVDLDQAVAEFTQRVARLGGTDRGVIHTTQAQLDGGANLLLGALAERRAEQGRIEAVIGHEAHNIALRDLVLTARRQIVVACPWIDVQDLNRHFELFRDALRRGVRIHLLWGIDPQQALDSTAASDPSRVGPVIRLLAELATSGDLRVPGIQLRLDPDPSAARTREPDLGSASSHAKVVVCDERAVLVTSLNVLKASAQGTIEVGVLVRPNDGEQCLTVALELLEWARRHHPDYLGAKGILTLPSDFGGPPAQAPGPLPEHPSEPSINLSGDQDRSMEAAAISNWEQSWKRWTSDVRATAEVLGPSARVVEDGEHQSLLWGALRSARRRLLIASDRLSPEVVTPRFVEAIEARLRAGVAVVLINRRIARSTESASNAVRRLEELAHRFPQRLTLLSVDNHAKILVADDRAVIGSFNFLSFEGWYGIGTGSQRRRERSEVSLELRGRGFVDRVLTALSPFLGAATSRLLAAEPVASPSSHVPESAWRRSVSALLDRMLTQPAKQTEILTDWFLETDTPWADLATLEGAGLSCDVLREAAAAAVAACQGEVTSEERAWTARLSGWAWQEGRWLESLAFAGTRRSGSAPPSWLAALASALRDRKAFADLSTAVAGQELQSDEAEAVVALVAPILVLRGDDGAWDLLNYLEGQSGDLEPLRAASIDYWNDAGYSPIPRAGLPVLKSEAARVAAIDQARERALLAFTQCMGLRFPPTFRTGVETLFLLQHEDGWVGRAKRLLTNSDFAGAREWLEEVRALGTAGDLLDAATLETAGRCRDHLIREEKGRRSRVVEKLRALIQGVDDWLAIAVRPAVDPAVPVAAIRAFAEHLRVLRETLRARSVSRDDLVAPAIRSMFREFDPIFDLERP